jgi:hypothetical protein
MVSGRRACSTRVVTPSFFMNVGGTMLKTRLYVECPTCHMQYLMKDFGLTYSNGAYIEDVAGSPEWQRLICPCQPHSPYKFKLKERTRLHVLEENDSEKTHFSLRPMKASTCSGALSKS